MRFGCLCREKFGVEEYVRTEVKNGSNPREKQVDVGPIVNRKVHADFLIFVHFFSSD